MAKTAKKKSIAPLRIAIVGATGTVGSTLISILEERSFPLKSLFLLASARSEGEICEFKGKTYEIQNLEKFDFRQAQIVFFCAGAEVSKKFIPKAVAAGSIVIDKSSQYRNDKAVPLVVLEVNPKELKTFKNKNIIANPNCTTIPIAVALKPIYDAVGIKRINIATYQSVSGAGTEGIETLAEQTARLLNGQPMEVKVFSQQMAFNVIPHIDVLEDNGYTREEMKMILELRKIFGDPKLAVNPTAVRVPVFYGHSIAVHVETKRKISAAQAKKLLAKAPGVKLMDGKIPYATPVQEAAGHDEVFVGRVREDLSTKMGLNLWIVTDNLRKGAALNAIQIAEELAATVFNKKE